MICCKIHYTQGRNEARWRLRKEASLAPPCLNLVSFGSQFSVLKKVLVTLLGLFRRPANCVLFAPLVMLLTTPEY